MSELNTTSTDFRPVLGPDALTGVVREILENVIAGSMYSVISRNLEGNGYLHALKILVEALYPTESQMQAYWDDIRIEAYRQNQMVDATWDGISLHYGPSTDTMLRFLAQCHGSERVAQWFLSMVKG